VDITVAYPGTIAQNEGDLFKGNFPTEIHFLVQTYPNNKIPSHKDDLDNWCREQWSKKETRLREFYEKKTFLFEALELKCNESLVWSLFMYAWIAWILLKLTIAYFLWTYPWLWLYVLVCTLFYTGVSKFTKGFNILIADALNR